jgi:cob(I)alamin adenosyltransferase
MDSARPIATGAGDDGFTELPSAGGRVAKDDPRIEALGSLDELAAFVASASLAARQAGTKDALSDAAKDLTQVMSSIAVNAGQLFENGIADATLRNEARVKALEGRLSLHGFSGPARNEAASRLDIARTVCRRCERRLCAVLRGNEDMTDIMRYINRLGDLLYLLARVEEA